MGGGFVNRPIDWSVLLCDPIVTIDRSFQVLRAEQACWLSTSKRSKWVDNLSTSLFLSLPLSPSLSLSIPLYPSLSLSHILLFKSSQLGLDSNVLNSQEGKEIIVYDTRKLTRLKAVEEYPMRKSAALKIIALKNRLLLLAWRNWRLSCTIRKENVMELYQLQRRILWEVMKPYVAVQIKYLIHICQSLG